MQRCKFLATTAVTIPAIAFGQIFSAHDSRTTKGCVVKANESRFKENTILFGTSPNDIKVCSKDTDGQLTIFEYTGKVKGGPPLHIHLKQDEIFFIVEGEYKFKVGEEIQNLKSGDTIVLPRKVPHCADWLSIALETGYYDYQHLVKDFKQFSATSPHSLLEAQAKARERIMGFA